MAQSEKIKGKGATGKASDRDAVAGLPHKRASSRQRGQRAVKEAILMLQETGGFRSIWKPGNKAVFLPGGRFFSQSQDILEAFDLIAIDRKGIVWLVQVTHASPSNHYGLASERKQKIDRLRINPVQTVQLVMGKVPRAGWRIWRKRSIGVGGSYWTWIKLARGEVINLQDIEERWRSDE